MSDDTLTSLIVEAIGRHLAPIIKWLYGAGRGANISRHIAAINSAMASLGGNHQLTTQTP